MKKLGIIIVLVTLIGVAVWAQSTQSIAKTAFASTVLLIMEDANKQPVAQGSGFIVGDKLIATNYHMIEGASGGTAKLIGADTQYRIEGIVAADPARDLAILRVPITGAKALPMGDSNSLEVGDTVYAVGSPMGLEGTFSQGIVSGFRTVDSNTLIQLTASISPGSSGGPALNISGAVIGVLFATVGGGQNLNFAIPINYLKTLMQNIGAVKPFPASNTPPAPNTILPKVGGESPEENTPGQFLYVANHYQKTVSAYRINPSTGALGKGSVFPTGKEPSIFVNPSSKHIYVQSSGNSFVSVYSINSRTGALTRVGTTNLGRYTSDIAFTPSGKFAYTLGDGDSVIAYAINLGTGSFTSIGTYKAGWVSSDIAVDPEGKYVYVTSVMDENISVYSIDPSTGVLASVGKVATKVTPWFISIIPSGRYAYVRSDDSISAYRIDQRTGELSIVGTPVAVGGGPSAIVVDPSSKYLYVPNGADILAYCIDSSTGELIDMEIMSTDIREGITRIAVAPSGKYVYVQGRWGGFSTYSMDLMAGTLRKVGAPVATGFAYSMAIVDFTQ